MPSSTHRFSRAVSRFFRALHKKQPAPALDDSSSSNNNLNAESLALSATTLPAAFFKAARSLLERADHLQQHQHRPSDDMRASTASTPTSRSSLASPPNARTSVGGGRKRQQHTDDCYARLAKMLAPGDSSATTDSRTVAVPVAVETLLDLWELLLQLLQSDEQLDATPPAIKQSVVVLLQAIVQRHEFDVVLNSLASGACSAHRSVSGDATGVSRSAHKRRTSSVRLERVGSIRLERAGSIRLERASSIRVVPAASVSATTLTKKSSRRSLLKKSKRSGRANNNNNSSSSGSPLCVLMRRYLSLHQATLQLIEDAVTAAAEAAPTTTPASGKKNLAAMKQVHELLAVVVATSYIRIPFLREEMTAKLEQVIAAASASSSRSQRVEVPAHLVTDTHPQSPLPLFQWDQSLPPKCSACVAPFSRDECWSPNARFVETILSDADSRMLLFGNIVQHFTTASAWGRVEWKRVPGFSVLVDLLLASIRALVQSNMKALEAQSSSSDDDVMERASLKDTKRSAGGLKALEAASPSSPGAFFFRQALRLVGENQSLLHSVLLVVFKNTNYMLPHHVEVCFQYLERFAAAFPGYFRDEPSLVLDSVDIPLLQHVFSCLLESEHFEILKSSELFLLKHFASFSLSLRTALTDVFAAQFRRLFLHWHRDVRYCYFHVLLYLTYAGNRIVLCARSDESVLGAEASQLFEIPGLVRTPAMAAWDVFDAPLYAMLTRYNRVTRQLKNKSAGRASQAPMKASTPPTSSSSSSSPSPTAWVDDVPFTVLARSVPEYRRLVQTYFQSAKQLSLHEPVPVPVFYVKGSAPHS